MDSPSADLPPASRAQAIALCMELLEAGARTLPPISRYAIDLAIDDLRDVPRLAPFRRYEELGAGRVGASALGLEGAELGLAASFGALASDKEGPDSRAAARSLRGGLRGNVQPNAEATFF
jgi:hypothetical protein